MSQTPEELGKKIREARERQGQNAAPSPGLKTGQDGAATGKALRAATDLVAALCVGGFLGYGIDRWLGTKPWGMILFFFLGFAAGFLNIYRAQMGQDYKIGFKADKKEE